MPKPETEPTDGMLLENIEVEEVKTKPVVPNFLHDLESFWWLHLWTMLRVHHPESSIFASMLFKNSTEPSFQRYDALKSGIYEDLTRYLHKSLKPLARACDFSRGVIYKEFLQYDTILDFPLSGNPPTRLMQLCDICIKLANESTHPIPNLKPFTSVVPEQPVVSDDDDATSHPTEQSGRLDQAKSAGSKSTRGRKPTTSNVRSITSSRITRSSSVRKLTGGSGSTAQSAGGSASKSIDEGTPREEGVGPARKIRRTS